MEESTLSGKHHEQIQARCIQYYCDNTCKLHHLFPFQQAKAKQIKLAEEPTARKTGQLTKQGFSIDLLIDLLKKLAMLSII
jgi:hypothetical protein